MLLEKGYWLAMSTLENFRQQIDVLDAELIKLLGHRFEVCRKVARLKKERGIPMMQQARIGVVKERCVQLGMQYQVDKEFILDLYDLIIKESCRIEEQIINGDDQSAQK